MVLINDLAIISRFVVVVFGVIFMLFFLKRYQKSKIDSPSPNIYFLGQTLFFVCLSVLIFLVALQELLLYLNIITTDLTDWQFPNYDENAAMFGLLKNLIRPIYIILQAIAILVFAVQIYPLETILGSKKIVSKLAVVSSISLGLIYIPFLTFTYYTLIVVFLGYIMLLVAFLVNFILTSKIIRQATGDVRRRAIMNITGFFIFLVGLVWTMRVGWTKAIGDIFNYDVPYHYSFDVVFGDITILIAMYIMYSGVKEN
jgi:hypothetical protein